jgi:hypothetical protein
VPDPYASILEESDSLLLSRDQAEALQKADTAYRLHIDSVWTALSEYLASLGDDYDPTEALKKQEAAVDEGWEISRLDVQRTLPKILSPIQLKLLPGIPALLYKAKEKIQIRMFQLGS